MKTSAMIAASVAITAHPPNINHCPCLIASPKVGGPIATPKKRTVPYKHVIIPLRSVLVAPVIKEFMGGSNTPILIPVTNSNAI